MAWQHVAITQDAVMHWRSASFPDSRVRGSIQVACKIEGHRAELELWTTDVCTCNWNRRLRCKTSGIALEWKTEEQANVVLFICNLDSGRGSSRCHECSQIEYGIGFS